MCDLKADSGDVGSCGWQHLCGKRVGKKRVELRRAGLASGSLGSDNTVTGLRFAGCGRNVQKRLQGWPEVGCRKAAKLTWVFG